MEIKIGFDENKKRTVFWVACAYSMRSVLIMLLPDWESDLLDLQSSIPYDSEFLHQQ